MKVRKGGISGKWTDQKFKCSNVEWERGLMRKRVLYLPVPKRNEQKGLGRRWWGHVAWGKDGGDVFQSANFKWRFESKVLSIA